MTDETDEDLADHLDPELDAVIQGSDAASGDGDGLPGPLSLSRLVVGVHVVTAMLVTGLAALAARNGNLPQAATLTALAAMLLVAGIAAGRIAARRG
ncbi:hypothetical protein [Halosegnis sp.]|uniref:hypothetical protein n=1 Tax=Halosegnis sp. TaxID=2864959 RepID=UPI0035D42E1D